MSEQKSVKLKNIGNKFIRLKCAECNNEQVTYSKGSSKVICNICGATLAIPTGGLISISGEKVKEY
ncbi:MAG: 30S ribosomal protein S27e [Thermoplasmataceae archaeon]